jgi:hypothetical protein
MANLLILNFGTFAETNRFKALGIQRNFVAGDLMDDRSPGELVQSGGVRQVLKRAGTDTYSFHGLNKSVWRSKLSDGTTFKEGFQKWMEQVLGKSVHCVYMTGHHWSDERGSRTIMSWGEDTGHFHLLTDTGKQTLQFGISADRVAVDTKNLRSDCKLMLGFGCNVATGINSAKYQEFFGGGESKPIILGWDRSIRVPRSGEKSVNERFFDYLDTYAKGDKSVPDKDRLAWFYEDKPIELVRAWGYATILWFSGQARARDEKGNFYKFKVDKAKASAEPVKV